MRENWRRPTEMLRFSKAQIETLLNEVFPNAQVLEQNNAEGGLTNTNIRVRIDKLDTPLLLRIHERRPEAAAKEVRIKELISDRVPVPKIYSFENSNSITGHPVTVMQFIDEVRLESIFPSMSPQEKLDIALSLGETLAAINSFKFDRAGFLDSELKVTTEVDLGLAGLSEFAHHCLDSGIGKERLGDELIEEFFAFIERSGSILNTWNEAPCLTHSDFGGSNILVQKHDRWKVAAVLDWEFAFSGSPFFDLGNLLRPPVGDDPTFRDAVRSGYTAGGGTLPENWYQLTLLSDLSAWLDFSVRPEAGEALIQDVSKMIRRTMQILI